MSPDQFQRITSRYPSLRLAIVGDFCLDRYLEIDPELAETSIETGWPVHNVIRTRSQPGGAGTILNNLIALGVGQIFPVGFSGLDGEGWELRRALESAPGVCLDYFIETDQRRTFTYTKPLLIESGRAPRELNRLDFKNWSPTPPALAAQIAEAVRQLAPRVQGFIVLDQVDLADTGVVTGSSLDCIRTVAAEHPGLFILADSRRGLRGFPPVTFKMNHRELARLRGSDCEPDLAQAARYAQDLARENGQAVFVTLAEQGMLGASPTEPAVHLPALPLRGEIDIVGAGDAVTANLTAAMAAGAALTQALELGTLASSIVIHQLGTTGTASVSDLRALLDRSMREKLLALDPGQLTDFP